MSTLTKEQSEALEAIREWVETWNRVCAAADPSDEEELPTWEEVVATALPDWNTANCLSADFWRDYMHSTLVYLSQDLVRAFPAKEEA